MREEKSVPHKTKLRTGFTTGACAAAAAKAALKALCEGGGFSSITTTLPNGQVKEFALHRLEQDGAGFLASIIKDGGDDPDCTHGAEIVARVSFTDQTGILIEGGYGVARVTRPGLGLQVGEAAINPVPRKNIREMVEEVWNRSLDHGLRVEISVPDGEERAKKTLNARLGLLGGLSILGTTGLVLPYSTSAFIASVVQAIQLAAVEGVPALVLTTGGRSEQYAMQLFPELPESAFIQVGDYVGIALRQALKQKIPCVHIVAMMGKLSKMADGKMMTHAHGSEVNMELLASLAASRGAAPSLVSSIRSANTARHVLELCQAVEFRVLPLLLCEKVKQVTEQFVKAGLRVSVAMVDFGGELLGFAAHDPKAFAFMKGSNLCMI